MHWGQRLAHSRCSGHLGRPYVNKTSHNFADLSANQVPGLCLGTMDPCCHLVAISCLAALAPASSQEASLCCTLGGCVEPYLGLLGYQACKSDLVHSNSDSASLHCA